jgi:hypothetical protein
MPGKLDSLQGVATALIKDFGKVSTLRTVSQTFSAVTGTTTETVTDTTVYATPPEPYKQYRVNGDTIRSTDLKTLIQGKGLSPKVGDRLIYSGVEYQIVGIFPQSAGTVIAFYEVQLRA